MKKISKTDLWAVIMFMALMTPLVLAFVWDGNRKHKFRSRVEYHNQFGEKANKWLSSDMASNVAELQDSALSADFKHYSDLSAYFQRGIMEYDVNKKSYDYAQTADNYFHIPAQSRYEDILQYQDKRTRFSEISRKTNGEFLDSLDKCVKKLDQRYNQLVAAKRVHQK